MSIKKIVLFLTVSLFFGLMGFYFYQVEELTKLGYQAGQYQAKIDEISSQNLKLSQAKSSLLSLAEVEKRALALNLVRVGEIKYITPASTHLAQSNR